MDLKIPFFFNVQETFLNNTIQRAVLQGYCNFYLRTKKKKCGASGRYRCYRPIEYVCLVLSTSRTGGAICHTAKRRASNDIPAFLKATFPSWREKNKDIFATNNQTIPVAGTIYDAQSANRLKPSSSK